MHLLYFISNEEKKKEHRYKNEVQLINQGLKHLIDQLRVNVDKKNTIKICRRF